MMLSNTDKIRLQELAHKWLNGTLSGAEQKEFDEWFSKVNDEPLTVPETAGSEEQFEKILLQKIKQQIGTERQHKVYKLWPRIAVAASVLLLLSTGGYFLLHKQPAQQLAENQIQDIAPGGNKAILSSHGKKYVLDNAKNGLIADQGNVVINKNADGQVSYNDAKVAGNASGTVYDTLTVPRGGQHELILTDGSKLSLNADTRLRFPERFTGNERKIELISGEVRFHVKHNSAMPFLVTVKGQLVKDIGTDFDINAYDDEPVVKTTLVEGSVEVSKGAQSKLLRPGQQVIAQRDHPLLVQTVNIDQVIAWDKGQFYFEKTNLKDLMRQVSRWYNIDVVYEGYVADEAYTGQPSRKENLSQMLKILEFGDVHFKIEPGKGKGAGRLIVTQ